MLADNNYYQSVRLQEIVARTRSTSKELIYYQLSEYLVDVLSPTTSVLPRRKTPVARHLTRRQVRKKEYSDTRRTWKRSRSRCAETILSGIGDTPQPPRERMESHWRDVITETATGSVPPCTSRPTLDGLWDPITPGEMRAMPLNVFVRVLNLMMWCERRLPKHLMDARTIFIHKKPDAIDPAGFWPTRYPLLWPDYFTVFWPKGSIAPLNSAKSSGPSGQASMVAETIPFCLIPSFAVDMS